MDTAVAALAPILASVAVAGAEATNASAVLVCGAALHDVDVRLFGQFLERPSWGERGVEAAVLPDTHRLQDGVVPLLAAMRIPVIRFPGGTDVDYIDWRDMIDNVPGRSGGRPLTTGHTGKQVSNHFGYDECFALRDALKCETILVLNLLDGLSRKKELHRAALDACGLVAYANAAEGAGLPAGMPDWPAVRARNGHPRPFRMDYVQLGNECWLGRYRDAVRAATGLAEGPELAQWYISVFRAYIETIRAIAPDLPIIIDCTLGTGRDGDVLSDPFIRQNVRFLAHHVYAPGPMYDVRRDGKPVPPASLSREEWWQALVAMPGQFDEQGQNQAFAGRLGQIRALGYEAVCTEWNWNGWGRDRLPQDLGFDWQGATGLGTAGFLHGLLRHGDAIRLANQSMLVGETWRLSAVHVHPDAARAPHYNTMGPVTTLYRLHHGPKLLRAELRNVPSWAQPYAVGWQPPVGRVAALDALITASDAAVFVHVVNRSLDRKHALAVDLGAAGRIGRKGVLHRIVYGLEPEPARAPCQNVGTETHDSIPWDGAAGTLVLPPRSITILELPVSR